MADEIFAMTIEILHKQIAQHLAAVNVDRESKRLLQETMLMIDALDEARQAHHQKLLQIRRVIDEGVMRFEPQAEEAHR